MDVLLAGNTEYLTEDFLDETFGNSQIVIVGKNTMKTNHNQKRVVLNGKNQAEHLKEALRFYMFEKIIYFSYFLTQGEHREGELEVLELLLDHCRRERDAHFVYVTAETDGRISLLSGAAARFCLEYAKTESLGVKIIQVPALYSDVWLGELLYQVFDAALKKEPWKTSMTPERRICFLSIGELGELIYRIFDSWKEGHEVYQVPRDLQVQLSELIDGMKILEPEFSVVYEENSEKNAAEIWNVSVEVTAVLREDYGWFPRYGILEEIPRLYEEYSKRRKRKKPLYQKMVSYFRSQPVVFKILELIAAAVMSEWMLWYTSGEAQLSMLDIRLLFVVVISTMYDMKFGMAAAFLASVFYGIEQIQEGINGLTLFYEPGNWIPFLAYFSVAAVCSYVQMNNRDRIHFVQEENALLRDKLTFVQGLYLNTVKDKKELRRQILGSRDSFGKIYDVIRKLDSTRPQKIFMRSIHVLEELMENNTVAIYSLSKNKSFARLEAASKDILRTLSPSCSVEQFPEAVKAAEKGELWVNRLLKEGYPMYMAGIRDNGELVLLLAVYKVEDSQKSLYFQNLMKILCGLIETTLLRAFRYQNAVWREQHIADSIFLKEKYFYEKLSLFHRMYEDQINTYTLMYVDRGTMSLERAGEILMKMTRENDVIGLGAGEKIYMILNQTGPDQAGPAIQRLEMAGFVCRIIEHMDEERGKGETW